ncbi:MAG: DUF5985 family protein [Pirellulaceae bacterium]
MPDLSNLNHFLGGAIAAGYSVAALFFLKFYFRTKDRLFVLFCAALLILGSTRVAMVLVNEPTENHFIYWLRLLAYLIILGAIIDKNRPQSTVHAVE